MATATDTSQVICDMPAAQYHADRSAVSKSALWDFWQRRRVYEARYVLRTAPPKEATEAMDSGTLTDTALLEPHKLEGMYTVVPGHLLSVDGGVRTKAAKEWVAEQEAAGKIVVKQEQFDHVAAMVESVRRAVGDWLKRPSKRQESIFWTNEETGLRCRARLDWRIETPSTNYTFDLKTTADASPRAFARRCEEHGYWMQDRQYTEGVEAVTNKPNEFYFLVVEGKFPYACNIQRIPVRLLAEAGEARIQALRDLKACLESGDFSEPWEQDIAEIPLRPWCFQGN